MDLQLASIRAMGELEIVRADIQALADNLERLPLWRPSAGLRKNCEAALTMLDRMAERLDRKLVITLVGPSGSGKSTLLNALAGDDHLSPAGHRRPTTEQVVAFCQQTGDADQLGEQLGAGTIAVHADASADGLENVILIDTPDTDSTHQDRHIPIIRKAIALSDVLVCVFDGENPKRRDHTDFLAPYVRLFSGRSLVVVVNKCDRLAEAELTDTIMPDFDRYIRTAWSVTPAAVLCVSARSRLENPNWDAGAAPRHQRDQFDRLKQLIVETFNRPGDSLDHRLANAHNLEAHLAETVHNEAESQSVHLETAIKRMKAAESDALQQAVGAFRAQGDALAMGINVRLYQQLAQRWLGPVGWLVAVWARILVFGTGLMALVRFGNPIRQLFGAFAAAKHYSESKKQVTAADRGTGAEIALNRYQAAIARAWPDIAETLIQARFDPKVRDARQAPGYDEDIGGRLSKMWALALESELSRVARRLSGTWLQLIFNLPVLGIMGYVGWLTTVNFFSGTILSGDFFLHAFWTILLILFLSFFLLQGMVRLASGKNRFVEQVFARMQDAAGNQQRIADSEVWRQAKMVVSLARGGSGAKAA